MEPRTPVVQPIYRLSYPGSERRLCNFYERNPTAAVVNESVERQRQRERERERERENDDCIQTYGKVRYNKI
jgi:hypothetical protein